MAYIIKRPGFRHPLHTPATYGIVINEFTGEPRRFSSRGAAKEYSSLSHMGGAEILETR